MNRRYTRSVRHFQVDHDDIRRQLARERDRLGAIGGFADDRHPVRLEHPSQALAVEVVIVGEYDPDGVIGGWHRQKID